MELTSLINDYIQPIFVFTLLTMILTAVNLFAKLVLHIDNCEKKDREIQKNEILDELRKDLKK